MRYLRALLIPLIAFAAVTVPAPVEAACTFTAESTYSLETTCPSGTETAPTLETDGYGLRHGMTVTTAFTVHVEAAAGVFTAGSLQAYLWNPLGNSGAGAWNRAPTLDITVIAGLPRQGSGVFNVTSPIGRIAFIPTGITVASKVWILASGKQS